jgi:hypothetical protein
MLREIGRSLREYISTYILSAWGLGMGVILALVGAYQLAYPQEHIAPWVWWTLGVITVLTVPFMAFHKVRVQRDALTQELEGFRRPKVSGEIVDVVAGVNTSGEGTLLLTIALRNEGTPTILDEWEVFVGPQGLERRHLQGMATFLYDGGGGKQVNESDFIYKKVESTPIPTGGKQTGFIFCRVPPGLNVLQQVDAIRVLCRDVARNEHTLKVAPGGSLSSVPKYTLGLDSQQFLPGAQR